MAQNDEKKPIAYLEKMLITDLKNFTVDNPEQKFEITKKIQIFMILKRRTLIMITVLRVYIIFQQYFRVVLRHYWSTFQLVFMQFH